MVSPSQRKREVEETTGRIRAERQSSNVTERGSGYTYLLSWVTITLLTWMEGCVSEVVKFVLMRDPFCISLLFRGLGHEFPGKLTNLPS
ncbi:hypothetical protein M378DRAFT_382042 [Amanita muscaria Koide BX008]|uniref:Uncharacterized protein n=1 Tax=Amanita muscaria (strain Koide BX008) TaxID=946122 RepID=A0A0C2W8L7_AMAMK|nr:hypothetical protein M378DRAFT_382042 [Amanita muscaria Koide BX008]